MHINRLELYKYNRMSNLPYDKFMFKPKSKINIVLGSNGMGKSSLLKELLPNVEDSKKEYKENGYKILTFEHNNRLYTLSYFREENKYSFIVDDNELNPSYNMKTFKRLIEEHFNLSKEVFNLLLGIDNLTTMSTGERKKWFTEILSDTDYEYGLVVYNKARTRYRELTGMLKMIESKLLKEYQELKENNTNVDKIKNEINYLESVKTKIIENMKKPEGKSNPENELIEIVDKYQWYKDISIDDNIDTEINNTKLEIEKRKNEIENLNKQIIDYTTLLNNNEKLISLEKELISIRNKLEGFNYDKTLTVEQWLDFYNYIENNYSELIDLFTGLKTLKNIKGINKINELEDKLISLKSKSESLEKQLRNLEYTLNDLEKNKNDKIVCPKCNHIWSPKFDKNKYEEIKEKYNTTNKRHDSLNKEIENLVSFLDKLKEKKDLVWKLSSIIKANESLRKLIKIKSASDNIEDKINEIPNIIEKNYLEIKHNIDKFKLSIRKEEILKQVKWSKDMSSIDKNKIEKIIDNLSDSKIKIIEELENLYKQYNKLKNKKKLTDEKKTILNKTVSLLKDLHYYKLDKYKELRQRYDLNIIDIINDMLTKLKDKLTDINVRKNKIKELEMEKKDLMERKKANNKIIEALSPNKGLLAKGLVEFVNNVINDMNTIISNIFDYDLAIKEINLEDGKLDFNFKLVSKGNEISDIRKGSSGMREVVDLAFKLVAMNILGMEDYPLILDEFGRALDNVHRANAYDYINELSNEMFSQVFIVTHNEDVFSRFPNANIVLLDKEHYKINI